MLTYQVRPRVFRTADPNFLVFPNKCRVRFIFEPKQAFGESTSGGRTLTLGAGATVFFNANSGLAHAESESPLGPLDVTIIEKGIRRLELRGSVLEVMDRYDSLAELEDEIASFYYGWPMLLNIEFADPPVVTRVEGDIGAAPFTWELAGLTTPFVVTDQDRQEKAVVRSWERFGLFSGLDNRRLLGALHYFHVATRLARQSGTPGEFLAEVLLNLSKTLEVLFPPATRDAIRGGLRILGYSEETIEGDFVPAIALRNEIDVGHVQLAMFSSSQLRVIHSYTENAEEKFRGLLRRVCDAVSDGTFLVEPYIDPKPSTKALNVIRRLEESLAKDAAAGGDVAHEL